MKKAREASDRSTMMITDHADLIRELRCYLGMSLNGFGRAIGYSGVHVSRLERRVTLPKAETLERICAAFNVCPEYFMGGLCPERAIHKPASQDASSAGIAERLKALRLERGLSQHMLSKKANVYCSLLSQVEANKRPLPVKQAAKLAKALDVSVDYLMHGDPNKKLFPVDEDMIDWLWRHESIRKWIWKRKRES